MIPSRNCYSNDLAEFNQILFDLCRQKNLDITSLGRIVTDNIHLISAGSINPKNKSLLVIGGTHGDEPAGCWGILSFLETVDANLFDKLNLYIIPVLNPSGFKLGNLNNIFDESTNEGYLQDPSKRTFSHEGKIIVQANLDKLNLSGLLTLHEDYDQTKNYFYVWERASKPGKFSLYMSDACQGIFEKYTGIADGFKVNDGIVFNLQNYEIFSEDEIDSLEFFLFKLGVKEVVGSEVPRIPDIEKRIAACRQIVKHFVNYY